MSTTRTRWPNLARAAARLIVVVVLPTPPFWLATARTRLIWLIDQYCAELGDWLVRRIENRDGRVNIDFGEFGGLSLGVLRAGIRGSGCGSRPGAGAFFKCDYAT